MTPEDRKQYIESRGLFCPFCESKELQVGEIELNEDQCEVEVSCDLCEKEWEEIYTLTDVKSTADECQSDP